VPIITKLQIIKYLFKGEKIMSLRRYLFTTTQEAYEYGWELSKNGPQNCFLSLLALKDELYRWDFINKQIRREYDDTKRRESLSEPTAILYSVYRRHLTDAIMTLACYLQLLNEAILAAECPETARENIEKLNFKKISGGD